MLEKAFTGLLLAASVAAMAAETNPDSAQGSDRDFVLAAAMAGQQEIHDAEVAAAQSRMRGVRHIAAMLLQDHRAANAQLARLVAAKGMAMPTEPPAQSPTPSFSDAEYVSAQIQSHEDAIALFKSEAANGGDREFRAFAAQSVPLLERHLKALRALQTP
jgi:putative membrane protein